MTMSLYPGSNYPSGFNRGVDIQEIPIETMINPNKKVIWVDANAALRGQGTRKSPYATIATAISKANAGDTIFIAAAHTEALTATSFICSKALTIIGLGTGTRVPTFTAAVVGGLVSITTSNVVISNIRLTCNYTGGSTQAVLIATGLAGVVLDKVQCIDTSATKEWLLNVSIAGTLADSTIQNCKFIGAAGTMTNSILFGGVPTRVDLIGNYIDVDSSDDTVDCLGFAAVNCRIQGNIVINRDTGAAGYCVRGKTASTGVVANNFFGYNKVDAEIFTWDAAFCFENYASNTIAESGLLDPTTSHAIP